MLMPFFFFFIRANHILYRFFPHRVRGIRIVSNDTRRLKVDNIALAGKKIVIQFVDQTLKTGMYFTSACDKEQINNETEACWVGLQMSSLEIHATTLTQTDATRTEWKKT